MEDLSSRDCAPGSSGASLNGPNYNSNYIKEQIEEILNEFNTVCKKLDKLKKEIESGTENEASQPEPSHRPTKRRQEVISADNVNPQLDASIKSRRSTLVLDDTNKDNEGIEPVSHTQRDDPKPGPSRENFIDLTEGDREENVFNNTIKSERISTPESFLSQDIFTSSWQAAPPNPSATSNVPSETKLSKSAFLTTKRRDNERLFNYFSRKMEQSRSTALPESVVCEIIIEYSKDESLISWARSTNCKDLKSLYDYITKITASEYFP